MQVLNEATERLIPECEAFRHTASTMANHLPPPQSCITGQGEPGRLSFTASFTNSTSAVSSPNQSQIRVPLNIVRGATVSVTWFSELKSGRSDISYYYFFNKLTVNTIGSARNTTLNLLHRLESSVCPSLSIRSPDRQLYEYLRLLRFCTGQEVNFIKLNQRSESLDKDKR